jgi:hypothetical protein
MTNYFVTLLDYTLIFEWYMARFTFKNGHQKDMWYKIDMTMCS